MILCHYLTPKNVVKIDGASSKSELLKTLVNSLCDQHNLKDSAKISEAILNREKEGSTFLPTGIAIPHARTSAVSEIVLTLGFIPEGFKETPESNPTHLVFLFLSPLQEKEFGRHLKLLSKISSIFRDQAFLKELVSAKSNEEIFSLIQHKERETIDS